MASRALEILLIGKDQSASAALTGLGKKVDETGKKTETFGALSTKALAAVGVAAVGLALKSADTFQRIGGEVLKLQRYTGDTAESASRLRYAASQSGVSVDDLSKALGIASKNMLKSKDSVKEFGVAIKDEAGKTRNMHDVLLDLSDRFQSMPNGAEKTALALKTFGRAGADLIPLLNKGSAGIGELEAKAKALGLEFNDEQLAKVKAYKAAQRDLTATLDGLQVKIGGAVVPMLTTLASTAAKVPGPIMEIAAPAVGAGVALLGVAAAGKKVWDIAGPAVTKLREMNTAMKESGDASSGAGLRMAGYAVAITAGIIAIQKLNADSTEFSTKLFDGLDFTNLDAATAKLERTGAQIMANARTWDNYSVSEKMAHLAEYKNINDAAAQQQEHNRHLEVAEQKYNQVGDAVGVVGAQVKEMASALNIDVTQFDPATLVKAFEAWKSGADGASKAQDILRASTDGATDAMKSQADEMKAATDPLFAMSKALDANADAQAKVEQLTKDVDQAQRDYDYARLTTISTSQQQKDAYDKLTAAQDALSAANDTAVRTAMDVTSAQDTLTKGVQAGTTSVQEGIAVLQQWVDQGLITQAQADATAEKFNYAGARAEALGGKSVTVRVDKSQIDAAVVGLQLLAGAYDVINTKGLFNASASVLAGSPSAHASGGSLADGWNIVGEHGPEPIYKAGSNAYVSGTGSSAGPRGGPSVTVNVYPQGNVIASYDLGETIRDVLIETKRTRPDLFGDES